MSESVNTIGNEPTSSRLNRANAIAQNSEAIKRLAGRTHNLLSATKQLERKTSQLATSISEQKDSINAMVARQSEFLELALLQADIISQIVGGKTAISSH